MAKNENLIRRCKQRITLFSHFNSGILEKLCTGCNYEWKKYDVTKQTYFSQYHLPKHHTNRTP